MRIEAGERGLQALQVRLASGARGAANAKARRAESCGDVAAMRAQPLAPDAPGAARTPSSACMAYCEPAAHLARQPARAVAQARREQSSRDGLASSAAAVGVGARRSAAKSAMVKSVSCPTPTTTGMRDGADGARQRLLVELPQVLDRAAAAHEEQHVALGARARPPRASRRCARPRLRPAPAPGRRSPAIAGLRRASVVSTSRSAAAASEVSTPIAARMLRQLAALRGRRTGPRRSSFSLSRRKRS